MISRCDLKSKKCLIWLLNEFSDIFNWHYKVVSLIAILKWLYTVYTVYIVLSVVHGQGKEWTFRAWVLPFETFSQWISSPSRNLLFGLQTTCSKLRKHISRVWRIHDQLTLAYSKRSCMDATDVARFTFLPVAALRSWKREWMSGQSWGHVTDYITVKQVFISMARRDGHVKQRWISIQHLPDWLL